MKPACLLVFLASVGLMRAADPVASANSAPPSLDGFSFRDGNRVVLLGSAFFERDYEFGFIETAITSLHPDLNLRFRNLAWSGDNVWGAARSYFGPPAEGLERLKNQLEQIKPTVVLCNYGGVEAWDGPAKIDAFLDGYGRLLDLVDKAAAHPRVLVISPPPCERKDPPLPDLTKQNENLAAYRDALKKLAAARHLPFLDAFQLISDAPKKAALTDNGVHFNAAGYRFIAGLLPRVIDGGSGPAATKIDEKLRAAIVEKNRLFFYRWRPENETYLFGFRKHEQGRNGAEIPLFDPLIEAKEKEIAQWKAVKP